MIHRTRHEQYLAFLDFIRSDNQHERSIANRRMFSVFFWCFLLPALLAIVLVVLIKLNVIPRTTRAYLEWMILVFPVLYSVYFLGSEMLKGLPRIFRLGGTSSSLIEAQRESAWRERVCEGMHRSINASSDQWKWILSNFRMDLQSMQYRTRYLTALAGAVFFLIMQGIDSITEDPMKVSWIRDPMTGWVDAVPSDIYQFVGLGLFLFLLYLSGSQTHHALQRYLNCAELMVEHRLSEKEPESR